MIYSIEKLPNYQFVVCNHLYLQVPFICISSQTLNNTTRKNILSYLEKYLLFILVELKDCFSIPRIPNGWFHRRFVEHSKKVHYNCYNGYSLKTFTNDYICDDGKLKGDQPRCERGKCYLMSV